jgi:hypothetical protein
MLASSLAKKGICSETATSQLKSLLRLRKGCEIRGGLFFVFIGVFWARLERLKTVYRCVATPAVGYRASKQKSDRICYRKRLYGIAIKKS